jgi:hypothetical protein
MMKKIMLSKIITNKKFAAITIIVLVLLLIAATLLCVFFALRNRGEAVPAMATSDPVYAYTEFDPNETPPPGEEVSGALSNLTEEQIKELEKQLAEAGASIKTLEEANAEYEKIKAEQDKAIRELENERTVMRDKLPPTLAPDKIYGTYNGISELATLEYNYTVNFESEPEGNFFTKVERLYIVSGKIKIGVDYDDATKAIKIDNASKTVTVTIPKAHIISNELDEKSVKSFDLKMGWFSEPDDIFAKNAEKAKTAAEKELLQNDMFTQAQRLAGIQIQEQLEKVTSASAYTLVIVYE